MTPILWAVSDDGAIEYLSLSSEYLEGGLAVMRDAFFKHEAVAIAVEVAENPDSIKELEEMCIWAARDGVSLIALDKINGKIIGAAFNKLQSKENPEGPYLENLSNKCKHESSKALLQFMIEADAACDLFEYYNVDCLLEIMFLATLPEYRGKGVAKKLTEISIELAKSLLEGKMVKQSVDNSVKLKLEPVPKVVSAIYTSHITQKIGKNLGFKNLATISMEKFIFKGKSYADILGDHTLNTTLDSLKL